MQKTEEVTTADLFQPRRLGHVNLFVSDYEKSAAFYNQIVGFEEVYRQPDNQASFLTNGNTYHDLALTDIRSKYATKDQKPGMFHWALELETERDLVDGYDRALASGVEFEFIMDHDVARSVYKKDPDGNLVEIYADVEKDWRAVRTGIIIKEKPKWIPGVTSVPLTEKNYPQDPDLVVVHSAVFHSKKIAHVALVADDFEKMFSYYTDIIGLKPMAGGPDGDCAVLHGTASNADLTLYRKSGALPPSLHHVGFEVWSESDLNSSKEKLEKAGIKIEREIDHPARRSIVIKDPDGLLLQFFVNRNWSASELGSLSADEKLYML